MVCFETMFLAHAQIRLDIIFNYNRQVKIALLGQRYQVQTNNHKPLNI